ncbi:MAG: hypothetical protein IPP34_06475 [Bacteroidetes bacterium]|nr:hypothetical protein [Bacteroidota bacterium]
MFGLKLPLLIFKENRVTGGVFDNGISDAFVHTFPDKLTAQKKDENKTGNSKVVCASSKRFITNISNKNIILNAREVGIEIIAVLISILMGGLLPLSKKFAENYLRTSLKSGKINETQEFVAKLFGIEIEEPTSYKQRH